MASRFIRCEIVKAGGGSSATGLSAYIARDTRIDQNGNRFNFTHRADELESTGLILPAGAPEWAADAARVWREAERAEQTVDRATGELRWKKGGQVAKHFTIALPREGTDEQRRGLLLAFIAKEINPQQHAVVVEWAIHRDEGNPHAHLLISTRALAGVGFGKKARAMNPDFASKGDRHFVGEADNWDIRWAVFQKEYFARLGIQAEVRERRPVPEDHYTRGQFKDSQVIADREEIALANDEADLARLREPAEILDQLTANKAVFTERDLRQALNKSGLDGDERATLEAAIIDHPDTIALVFDGPEGRPGDAVGWTTRQVREEEQAIVGAAERMGVSPGRRLGAEGRTVLAGVEMSAEQRIAAAHITGARQISIVIGRAGTGKSHTLNAVRRAFEAEGLKVIGLAPTNAVVADLRLDGHKHAATLHRALGQVERDPSRWNGKTVVMVDEAAMMDNGIMARLLKEAERSGAKLILAGDDRQFASVSRGGMFTELVNLHGAVELKTVHRQRQAYQAEASENFARGDIHAALQAYDDRGQIVWCDSLADARARAVAAQAASAGPSFLYASTNKEVEQLNRAEQERRRASIEEVEGPILAYKFKTVRGEVSIAVGERVQFYVTNRKLGMATSEFGTVKAVSPGRMEIVKDDGATVAFDPVKYDKWGLGYSGTGYKGQGKTQVKTAAVYDNPYAWDMRAAYVIGTRHKEDYQLFVPRELAPDLAALISQIMRQREDKGSSLRFEVAETYNMRHRQAAEAASQKLRAALEKGSEVLTAAKAERERQRQIEAERLRQAEELRKTQELKQTLRPSQGPSMGM